MLARDKRLNLKKDFNFVISGQKLEDGLFKVFIKPGSNLQPKIGIASSAKIFKKAVDRNRARRLTSKGFEELYPDLPNSINIIALPKQGVLELKSDQVKESLVELLRKGGVIK